MPQLPYDVYLRIAEFLPDSILRELFTVASFFEIAMDARYRETTISLRRSMENRWNLRRLKDPFIAKRVRRLNVHLTIEDDSYDLLKKKKKIRRSWGPFLDRLMRIDTRYRTAHVEFQETMQQLVDVTLGLSNVTVLHIRIKKSLLHDRSEPFFASALNTFAHNLRVLSLECHISCLRIPLSLDPPGQLRELRLNFSKMRVNNASYNTMTLCNIIVPAVSRFIPTLRCLSVSYPHLPSDCGGHLNLSPFFLNLEPFPLLEKLAVHVPICCMSDPFGLTHFLRNHANSLRHVSINLGCYFPVTSTIVNNMKVLKVAFNNIIFTNLQTFEFGPPLAFPGSFDVLSYIVRSTDTLTDLTVSSSLLLSYEDVTSIVCIFSRRPPNFGLQSLSLGVQVLEPRLVALLATKFPDLKRLHLRCGSLSRRDYVTYYDPLVEFRAKLIQEPSLYDWNLRELTLTPARVVYAHGDADEFRFARVKQMVVDCVPTLKL